VLNEYFIVIVIYIVLSGDFFGGNFPQTSKLPPPQEFSATPAVKLKIMSILD